MSSVLATNLYDFMKLVWYTYHMRGNIELRAYVRRRIEEARQIAGYNKSEMARLLNMGKGTYLDLDSGRSKFMDVVLLQQIADATNREITFFLPDAKRPDLAAALLSAYPDLTPEQVRDALDYVASLAALARRRHTLRNALDEQSTVHTGDTAESQESSPSS
jgi:transcriptional regulator with XRE-family HTH domain